jgi:hypothetical protein
MGACSRLVGLLSIFGLLFLGACAAPTSDAAEQPSENGEESALSEKYDIDALLEDNDVRGGDRLSQDQIQSFLETKGSYLASYTEGGRSAAKIIHDSCTHWNINPVYMLARIQIESSLISSGTSRSIKAATGCACPDGASCDRHSAGFAQQVECAATLHATYFDEMDRTGETRAAWGVGKKNRTLDPCSITPRNKATAAIYTYTPWVGPRGKQCSSHGSSGSSSMVGIYKSYVIALSAPPP